MVESVFGRILHRALVNDEVLQVEDQKPRMRHGRGLLALLLTLQAVSYQMNLIASVPRLNLKICFILLLADFVL